MTISDLIAALDSIAESVARSAPCDQRDEAAAELDDLRDRILDEGVSG